MGMKPLVILGASGHGRVVADAARVSGHFTLLGFLDHAKPVGATVDGLNVLGGDDVLAELAAENHDLQVIIGLGSNEVRRDLAAALAIAVPDVSFATVIHPASVVAADVTVGPGTFIAAGVVINCGATIGAHAIVNTSASVDHDCFIEDYAFIAPCAGLAGNVRVGRGALIGTGAAVIPGIEIGAEATVGAGAAVVRAVPAGERVGGVPSRPIGPSSTGPR